MSKHTPPDPASAIAQAIRAKRDARSKIEADIAAIEAALLVDIERFDLEAAAQQADAEAKATASKMPLSTESRLNYPPLSAPPPALRAQAASTPSPGTPVASASPPASASAGSLLAELRQQAEERQRQAHLALTERNATNEAINRHLKKLFYFLHDLVQQLNIVKPEVPRHYALLDHHDLGPLSWQEGFADYRAQSQSAGALVEMVHCSYHLSGNRPLHITREGPAIERFRTQLFDFGVQFTCEEFRNARRHVERATFRIEPDLSVSARWRADFERGEVILETRNLERLGGIRYAMAPEQIDDVLMDDFGRLMLGQPNRFREVLRRT